MWGATETPTGALLYPGRNAPASLPYAGAMRSAGRPTSIAEGAAG
jgi:hypothetical protein